MTRQAIKRALIRILNRALMLFGPDDVRVIDLVKDTRPPFKDFQIAKTIGPKGMVGTVRAEIILRETW